MIWPSRGEGNLANGWRGGGASRVGPFRLCVPHAHFRATPVTLGAIIKCREKTPPCLNQTGRDFSRHLLGAGITAAGGRVAGRLCATDLMRASACARTFPRSWTASPARCVSPAALRLPPQRSRMARRSGLPCSSRLRVPIQRASLAAEGTTWHT